MKKDLQKKYRYERYEKYDKNNGNHSHKNYHNNLANNIYNNNSRYKNTYYPSSKSYHIIII